MSKEYEEYISHKSAVLIDIRIDTERMRYDAMKMRFEQYKAAKEYYELLKKKLEEV